jgi:5'-phosphate synthase pdxT subunit
MAPPLVGILALQGDYAAHAVALERLRARTRLVRAAGDLEGLAGMIIPGGESTTMLLLLERNGLRSGLAAFATARPTFGTCAGLILLAREVTNPDQDSLHVLDVSVVRNAYGRQIDSFVGRVDARALGGTVEGVFIRAPRLARLGPEVEVLGRLAPDGNGSIAPGDRGPDGEPVLVREGHVLAATFHPELTTDPRIHRYFLEEMIGRGSTPVVRREGGPS